MLSLQAAINMAVATVSVPTKGLSLPLISAGGTGLLITAAALGLMYSVARTADEENETPTPAVNPPQVPGMQMVQPMQIRSAISEELLESGSQPAIHMDRLSGDVLPRRAA